MPVECPYFDNFFQNYTACTITAQGKTYQEKFIVYVLDLMAKKPYNM